MVTAVATSSVLPNWEKCIKIVSPHLFNFILWVAQLGYSDDPQESGYVDMGEELAVKVFSLCQDLFTTAANVELRRQNLLRWQWLYGRCLDIPI